MKRITNDTHDPKRKSWIDTANDGSTDFPIQNLPLGVFQKAKSSGSPRVGVAIGDQIVDVSALRKAGFFTGDARRAAEACNGPALNPLMALGPASWSALRRRLSDLLRADSPDHRTRKRELLRALVPQADARMMVPAEIGDYTDFYASIHHAERVGGMFRPENPLLPNYKYVPIGYHGRASSVVVSGTPVRRPMGQTIGEGAATPAFTPSGRLDYELEVGFFVGPGNMLGEGIPIEEAERHIFGFCLVNDWSARDIQKWEYQPLGPFLSKSFATTVSPWVVTVEALSPFRVRAFERSAGDPAPLRYLDSPADREAGGIELTLDVSLASKRMREAGIEPLRLSRGNFRHMYWTAAQMLAHHSSNGCNLRTGDLLASGTVSGEAEDSAGCLLELTQGGRRPIELPTGEERRFLEDGDEVILRGRCERDGWVTIGFGECRGTVQPAAPIR